MRVTSSLENVSIPTAVALGNFDGIHQGHRQVIQPILKWAKPDWSKNRGLNDEWINHEVTAAAILPTVVTFHPHPQEFFTGQPRTLLTPIDEKVIQLQAMGVEQLMMLPFNRELASLSPEQFVEEILVKGLQAKEISVGQDFCFGRKRAGTAADLQTIAATYGVEVKVAALKLLNGDRISSSAIRAALHQGNLQYANYLLGRPYSLVGTVVPGQQLGRTIGFATANLQLPQEKFLPCYGVYAVRVQIGDRPEPLLEAANLASVTGVMNLGMRPTVAGTRLVAEVHLFDWSTDLYGSQLTVNLEHFLRSEQKFPSLDALKTQIHADCKAAKACFQGTA